MFNKHGLASALIVVTGALGAATVYAGGDKAHKSDDSAWSSSSAQSSGSMSQTSQVEFSELDQNGDGYISEQELDDSQKISASHGELDSDQDGQVDRSEFAAFELQEQSDMQQDPMGGEAGSMDGTGTSGSGTTEPDTTSETW